MLFLTLACLIAAIGVVTDSTVTVVGAMVLGPEFGPLAALSVALVQRTLDLARRAALALLVGFPMAMVVTAVCHAGRRGGRLAEPGQVRNVSEVDFIFQVGPLSFVVALLAGAAGMLSLVSSKSAALVGVFISVTTVPAAGFAVVAAMLGDWDGRRRVRGAARGQPGRHHRGRRAGAGAMRPRGTPIRRLGADVGHRARAMRACRPL